VDAPLELIGMLERKRNIIMQKEDILQEVDQGNQLTIKTKKKKKDKE